MNPDLISAVANTLTAFAGSVMCYQLFLIKSHFNEEHRIRKNACSLELLRWWVEQLARESSAARHFVEALGTQECKALCSNEHFQVLLPADSEANKKHRFFMLEQLRVCLGDEWVSAIQDQREIKIDTTSSARIRYYCMRYINSTEAVMAAWHHNIADWNIIHAEMSFVIHLGKKYKLLENFRQAAGGEEAFPAVYKFINNLPTGIPDGELGAKG